MIMGLKIETNDSRNLFMGMTIKSKNLLIGLKMYGV